MKNNQLESEMYEQKMLNTYQSYIQNGNLRIWSDKLLQSFKFVEKLNITNLYIHKCTYVNFITVPNNILCLTLCGGNSKKIAGLKQMTQLLELALKECRLQNIEELIILTNLTVLHLDSNFLKDISGLTSNSLQNLTELKITNNPALSDISYIQYLKQLTVLSLENSSVSDVSALYSLIHIKDLNLSKNSIQSIHSLQFLRSLTKLLLNRNQIIDLFPLTELQNISQLGLNSNQIHLLPHFKHQIQHLVMVGNFVQDLHPLNNQINLNTFILTSVGFEQQTAPKELQKTSTKIFQIQNQILKLKQTQQFQLKTKKRITKVVENGLKNVAEIKLQQIQFTGKVVFMLQHMM
ncbi:Conserved_hypothetical protein [Hexamita inflata]|uniref:Uncharacterized protein n=1 Tax=Hexamita inflata TaxID=28002 RepID=A0AA86QK91_9EUKA|nr:Conserved hypothetical protein [Hexamita inflata]